MPFTFLIYMTNFVLIEYYLLYIYFEKHNIIYYMIYKFIFYA